MSKKKEYLYPGTRSPIMSEQAENERICKWLGWKRCAWNQETRHDKEDGHVGETPTFRTGNDMVIMLDQLQSMVTQKHFCTVAHRTLDDLALKIRAGKFTPDLVRAAVISLIEAKS